jgi:protein-disulfide isomerase-like protein with CxxC motif
MSVLTPQTKNTKSIPTNLVFQNGNYTTFQNGNFYTVQQWIQAIINVILKD